jgi:hypothetical protein
MSTPALKERKSIITTKRVGFKGKTSHYTISLKANKFPQNIDINVPAPDPWGSP